MITAPDFGSAAALPVTAGALGKVAGGTIVGPDRTKTGAGVARGLTATGGVNPGPELLGSAVSADYRRSFSFAESQTFQANSELREHEVSKLRTESSKVHRRNYFFETNSPDISLSRAF